MDVSRLMILLKEAWSRVRDEGVGVMGDFIGKPFTATTMSELNYLVNAPLESINREPREELGICYRELWSLICYRELWSLICYRV